MSERKAVIKNADMSEDMQQDAIDSATQVGGFRRWILVLGKARLRTRLVDEEPKRARRVVWKWGLSTGGL